MNFEKKLKNLIKANHYYLSHKNHDDKLTRELKTRYDIYVLLDISEPIMFLIKDLDEYYLAYTLQNRTILLKSGTKADVSEILFSEVSTNILKNLLYGLTDIRSTLSSERMVRIGQVGKKIFSEKVVSDIEEISDRIPIAGVCYNEYLVNKIDIKKTLKLIESDMKILERFNFRKDNKETLKDSYTNSINKRNNLMRENKIIIQGTEIRIEVNREVTII